MSMSPSDGDRRREQAKQRQIGTHAADVNREERDDERQRPAAIDRRPRPLGGLDLGGHRDSPGCSASPSSPTTVSSASSVVNTDATMMFQAMPKIRSAPAIATTHIKTHPCASSISSTTAALPHAAHVAIERSSTRGFERRERVAGRVDRKPAGDHESQRSRGDQRGVDQKERDGHADERADVACRCLAAVEHRSACRPSMPAAIASSHPTRAVERARRSWAPREPTAPVPV